MTGPKSKFVSCLLYSQDACATKLTHGVGTRGRMCLMNMEIPQEIITAIRTHTAATILRPNVRKPALLIMSNIQGAVKSATGAVKKKTTKMAAVARNAESWVLRCTTHSQNVGMEETGNMC